MKTLWLLTFLAIFNTIGALSFPSLYFKGNYQKYWTSFIIYLIFNLLLGVAGWLAGTFSASFFDALSIKAGGVVLLVVAVKTAIRAIRTKTISRIYDIGNNATLTGLLFVLNIDVFLVTMAGGLIRQDLFFNAVFILILTASAGFLLGGAFGKKAGFLLSNLLDAILAITLGVWAILALTGH